MHRIPSIDNVCDPSYHEYPSRIPYHLKGTGQIEDYHSEYSPSLKNSLIRITSDAGLCLDCVKRRIHGGGATSLRCRKHQEPDDDSSSTED